MTEILRGDSEYAQELARCRRRSEFLEGSLCAQPGAYLDLETVQLPPNGGSDTLVNKYCVTPAPATHGAQSALEEGGV